MDLVIVVLYATSLALLLTGVVIAVVSVFQTPAETWGAGECVHRTRSRELPVAPLPRAYVVQRSTSPWVEPSH